MAIIITLFSIFHTTFFFTNPVKRFEIVMARACQQVSELATGQSPRSNGVRNVCRRARDQCQSAAVTPPDGTSGSQFFVSVSSLEKLTVNSQINTRLHWMNMLYYIYSL